MKLNKAHRKCTLHRRMVHFTAAFYFLANDLR